MAFSKITTRGMSGDTLEAGDIAANAVGASELADNAVDTAAIAATSITEAKLNADVTDGSAIQTPSKPHIQPGTIYPAWRGLIDGHTGFTFTDSSATPKTITQVGTKVSHTAGEKKFGSTSLYFDGVAGHYLEITDHADFTFGTGNFTIEFFVNMGDQLAAYTTLIHSANHDVRVNIGASATAPKLTFYSDTYDAHTSGTTDIGDSDWHHCAIVREGTDLKIYVDGTLEATRASSGNSLDPDNIRIGQYATSHPFIGYIDDIRITKGLAVYTANFTAPTSALTTTWSAGTGIAANSTASNVSFLMHSDAGGHSGAYGTAQSDGRKYYYTDIKGSKPIKDPRIGAHFGSQRHKFKTIQILEQETATQGTDVYSIDGREWIKIYGGSPTFQNGANGNYINCANVGSDKVYVEIVGYFNSVNLIAQGQAGGTRRFAPYIDGGSAGTNTTQPSVNSPLESRYVDSAAVQNITFNSALTTPGIHTLKLINDTNDIGIYGIELIAQDTTSTANKSKIQIPSQNVVSYGKKFTVSGTPHYDPFNGFSNGTTLHSANVDTATSLGLGTGTTWGAPWAISSSNHIRPFNGGRVVKWVDSSGTIKTSVTMMPANAQNLDLDDDNEITTASATNTHTINFSDDAVEHSLAEVAKVFHNREFGNGAANAGTTAPFADSSLLWSTDDIAFCMDDGLTSLTVKDAVNTNTSGTKANTKCLIAATTSMVLYFTFIGTGIAWKNVIQSGAVSNYQLAQNLPYGSHVVKFNRSDYKIYVDGIHVQTVSADDGDWAFHEFTIYQPKMPPVPEDACILADYMLMADFVPISAVDGTHALVSKGCRRLSPSRDFFFEDNGSNSLSFAHFHSDHHGHAMNAGTVAGGELLYAQIPTFCTNFCSLTYQNQTRHDIYLDGVHKPHGSGSTQDNSTSWGTFGHLTTDTTVGLHKVRFQDSDTHWNLAEVDIATPIHTSHHYQPFETPFLHELIGGDRNMEQTNLVVTSDGKSWDEVTRDTSYIGNRVVHTGYTQGNGSTNPCVYDEWRGAWQTDKIAHNKDWAIGYNQIICLVGGEYRVSAHVYTHGTGMYFYMTKNASPNTSSDLTSFVYERVSSSDDHVNPTAVIEFKRGDYIRTGSTGGNMSGDGRHFLTIERLKK